MTSIDPSAPRPPAGIPLVAAASRCHDHRLSAASRRDPYWDQRPGTFVWHTIEQFRAAAERGYASRYHAKDRRAASRGLDDVRARPRDVVAALGPVYSYRTISVAQLAAVSGDTRLLGGRTTVLEALWALGLIEVGRWAGEGTRAPLFGPESLLRPGRRAAAAYDVLRTRILTWAEGVAVTGGAQWTQRGRYERHDVLATELALRLAEYSNVALALGEAYSTVANLVESVKSGRVKHGGAADLTLVRRDGMRIAVELTASTGSGFASKVERWARALAACEERDRAAVFVLFVVAPPAHARSGPRTGTMREVRSVLERVTRLDQHAGTSGAHTADLMGVVSWPELFPAPWTMAPDFPHLVVGCPPPPLATDASWRRAPLLGPKHRASVQPLSSDLRSINRSAQLLAQTPTWLVDPDRTPDLTDPLLRRVGWPRLVFPDYDLASSRTLGEGRGTARDTHPPRRLMGPRGAGRRR